MLLGKIQDSNVSVKTPGIGTIEENECEDFIDFSKYNINEIKVENEPNWYVTPQKAKLPKSLNQTPEEYAIGLQKCQYDRINNTGMPMLSNCSYSSSTT